MLNAAYLTTGFVVLAVGARYLVAGRHIEEGRTMLRMAIGLIAILAPLQLFLGDQHGLNTLQHQPIKIAAMEAHWDGSKPGDFHIFAWPDEKCGRQSIRTVDPESGVTDPDSSNERSVPRAQQRSDFRTAAGKARVFRLPHHARDRLFHDCGRAVRSIPVVARHIVRDALVSPRDRRIAGGWDLSQ